MNRHLANLYELAQQPERRIIGLMSGTSLDGLDVAVCDISGSGKNTTVKLLAYETVPYDESFKKDIQSVFAKKNVDLETLCLLNGYIGNRHAAIVNACLQKWKMTAGEIDLVASHGQTIYHAPLHFHQQSRFGNGSLQIGDGDHVSVKTGIITISDFRQRQIAAGGEGAPLACYGDYLLFSSVHEDVVLLNVGGISNFTLLPANSGFGQVTSSDIGPGNTLMDAWVQKHFPGKYFDEDAKIARQGKRNQLLLDALIDDPFFSIEIPKTTGPELFNMPWLEQTLLKSKMDQLPVEDILATLNYFTAKTIANTLDKLLKKNNKTLLYVSGGGAHNLLLMENLQTLLAGVDFRSTLEKNIHPDMKEAVLFAVLANECVAGNGTGMGAGTTKFPAVTMGKISFPG